MEIPAALNYRTLLAEAGRFHGDVCAGIEIGTRMAIAGLTRIGITDPKGTDRKNLIVFVEIDRCITDAIMAVTGCSPGKRSLKILDHGKMAATFVNLKSGLSVRIVSRGKTKAEQADPDAKVDFEAVPEDELFSIEEVGVSLRPEDLPGRPLHLCPCDVCGETVMDGREMELEGRTLCKPCFEDRSYYSLARSL